jgi:glycerophosphoryl diester phosphodiesterase
MLKPLIIAHRGDSSRALENSLEAFRLALSVPVDMIELDLRMSRDDVLYVMHDKQTGRTAGADIDIEGASSAEIGRLRLRNGEPVPTLQEVLALAEGRSAVNIEIKSDGAGERLARSLGNYHRNVSLMISSFKEAEVRAVRAALPGLRCALIYDTFSPRLAAGYRLQGYTMISLRKNTVTQPLVKACHQQGLQVFVWTVNEEDEMKRCIDWEVDGIYTNKPQFLKELLDRRTRAKT